MFAKKEFHSENDRWLAIVNRDREALGAFVYGVKSTGVFCHPNCQSRLPLRQNVRFFADAKDAKANGFRSCKKCNPDSIEKKIPDAVFDACRLIEQSDLPLDLNTIAKRVGLSPTYFQRLFKSTLGISPKSYSLELRAKRLRDELTKPKSVTAAIYDAGFGASSRCYETAKDFLGMTPNDFKNAGRGLTIRYTIVDSSLGFLLVAATDRGLCMVEFGSSVRHLRKVIQQQFARANLTDGDAVFQKWVSKVVQQIDSPLKNVSIPVDFWGTILQRKVWEFLRSIPLGSTMSYSEIARQIGESNSARAVANACAANRIAIVVPCHRAIRSNGSLSGYKWGIDRKEELLRREANG